MRDDEIAAAFRSDGQVFALLTKDCYDELVRRGDLPACAPSRVLVQMVEVCLGQESAPMRVAGPPGRSDRPTAFLACPAFSSGPGARGN